MGMQMALVTRVLDTGDLRTIRQYGIGHKDLTDNDASVLLEFIELHVKRVGAIPKRSTIQDRLPHVVLEDTEEDMEVLCDHVAEELQEIKYSEIIAEASDLIDSMSGAEAARKIADDLRKLSTRYGKTNVHYVGEAGDDEFRELTTENEMNRGVAYFWRPLQEATGGMHEHEVTVIFGRPKSTKTWSSLEQTEFSEGKGEKVLYFSLEMPAWQINRRLYSIRAELPYRDVVTKKLFTLGGKASKEAKLKLARAISSFDESRRLIVIDQRWSDERITYETIAGLVEEHQPTLVVIDQLHYMVPAISKDKPTLLGALIMQLKNLGPPVLATTQANREKDVALSDQIEQNVDALIFVKNDRQRKVQYYRMAAGRETDIEEWAYRSDFCTNLSYVPPDHQLAKQQEEKTEKRKNQRKQHTLR